MIKFIAFASGFVSKHRDSFTHTHMVYGVVSSAAWLINVSFEMLPVGLDVYQLMADRMPRVIRMSLYMNIPITRRAKPITCKL